MSLILGCLMGLQACSPAEQSFPDTFYCAALAVEQADGSFFKADEATEQQLRTLFTDDRPETARQRGMDILNARYLEIDAPVLSDYAYNLKCHMLRDNSQLSVKEQVLALEAFEIGSAATP